MKIEFGTKEDIPILVNFLTELFKQDLDFESDPEKQELGLIEILNNPELGQILVIKEKNEVIGLMNILFTISTALGGKSAIFEDFFIRKEMRRKGFGRILFNEAIKFVKDRGFLRVMILTDHCNSRAISFYEKNGFSRSAMIPLRRVF